MTKRPQTAAIRVCNFGLGILWEEEVQIFNRAVSRRNGVRADSVRLNSESEQIFGRDRRFSGYCLGFLSRLYVWAMDFGGS